MTSSRGSLDVGETTDTILRGIEDKEQQLIQQVRTSGIRKPRETSLIDEILDIRKDRRKLFTTLSSSVEELSSRNKYLEDTLKRQHVDIQIEVRSRTEDLEHRLQLSERERKTRMEAAATAQTLMRERFERALKEERKKVSSQYEEKFQIIDSKLNDLTAAKLKKETDFRLREESAAASMESEIAERVKRYKDALNTMVEREKDIGSALKRKSAQCHALEEQLSGLQARLAESESSLATERRKGVEYERRIADLEDRVHMKADEVSSLQLRLSDVKERAVSEAEAQTRRHQLDLQEIDQKIRGLLRAKDDTIARLQKQCAEAEEATSEMETLLQELNHKL